MLSILSLSIGIGLLVSLIFVGTLGLMTGGMVVPGYLALAMSQPGTVALTLVDALIIFGFIRLLSQFLIIYGRRRIAIIILFAFIWGVALRALFGSYYAVSMFGDTYSVIGFIIPGLIALSMDRQGGIETLTALLISAALIRMILILLIGPTMVTL